MNVTLPTEILAALIYGKFPEPSREVSNAHAYINPRTCKVVPAEIGEALKDTLEFVVQTRPECTLLWDREAYNEEFADEQRIRMKEMRAANIRAEMTVRELADRWLDNLMQDVGYRQQGVVLWRSRFDALLKMGGLEKLQEFLTVLGETDGKPDKFLK